MGMEDMKVRIWNVGICDSEVCEAWFSVPINMDEVREKIGLVEEEKYDIYEASGLPFCIEQDVTIEDVNRYCEICEEMPDSLKQDLRSIQEAFFGSLNEMFSELNQIDFYPEISSMEELADFLMHNCTSIGGTPVYELEHIVSNKDFARILEKRGNYLVTSNGMYVI